MKDINGNDLQQPYYDLAVMRREKLINTIWGKTWHSEFDKNNELDFAFPWRDTPEGHLWWLEVNKNNQPPIPQSSLAELEAWRKLKDISPVEDLRPKNGQTIYAIDPCIMKGFGYSTLTVGKGYMYLYISNVEFAVIDDKGHQHYFDIKEFDKYFSVTQPADTNWKAKYEELKADYGKLMGEYNTLVTEAEEYAAECRELKEIANINKPTTDHNFIAECAMAAMQGMLSDPSMTVSPSYILQRLELPEDTEYNWLIHYPQYVAKISFDYAEAMAAEGKKRGHIN